MVNVGKQKRAIIWSVVLIILFACCTGCTVAIITPEPTATPRANVTATATPPPGLLQTTTGGPMLPPAATATPTLTPTPLIHIVQEGEVLGVIAYQYGVSVEAIQAANGIEDPRYLQIGQALVIPAGERDAETITGLLLPTSTPMPLKVRGIALYETPVGSLWCLGELFNPNDQALTNLEVWVAIFDTSGALAADKTAFAAADLLPAGKSIPFGVLFDTPPEGWTNFQVHPIRGDVIGDLSDLYVPLSIDESDGQLVDNQFRITGTVHNVDPERAAARVYVVATIYDAQGKVSGFRTQLLPLEADLSPGASIPFDILLSFYGFSPADYAVLAVGRVGTE